jgi:hypothetical protein
MKMQGELVFQYRLRGKDNYFQFRDRTQTINSVSLFRGTRYIPEIGTATLYELNGTEEGEVVGHWDGSTLTWLAE